MLTHWKPKHTISNPYHFIKITSWDLIFPSNFANFTDHVTFFRLIRNWIEGADRTGLKYSITRDFSVCASVNAAC